MLIVDDAAHLRTLCSQILGGLGMRTIEAADGREAIALYEQHRTDVTLLDIAMPGLDGIAVLKEIIRLDPRARVCMVTAQGRQDQVAEALSAGALDFVLKPFEMSRVVLGVQNLLRLV